MANIKRGIHPVAAGVIGGAGVAAAIALSDKNTRKKVLSTISGVRENLTTQFNERAANLKVFGKKQEMSLKKVLKK